MYISNRVLGLSPVIQQLIIFLAYPLHMFLQVYYLLLTLLHFLLLHLFPPHYILYLLHRVLHVQCDTNRQRHLICVIYAHPKQPLHGFELPLILGSDGGLSLLVDELDDPAGEVLPLPVDRADQEVPHLSRRRLVVYLVLELRLLRRVVRDEDVAGLEDHA